ncbi:MAG: phage tail protein [Saprospiraceae bacterium]
MATDNNTWPLPKFYFKVTFGDKGSGSFQEVSGLDTETQIIEYRAGNSRQFSNIKMPGLQKFSNVTLKRGVFENSNSLFDYLTAIKMNTIERITVSIELLDESGKPQMTWTLANAWPTKITGTDLKSDGNEIAIESIELAHERLTIKTA